MLIPSFPRVKTTRNLAKTTLLAAAALVGTGSLQAVDIYFPDDMQDGNLLDSNNWSSGTPGDADMAIFDPAYATSGASAFFLPGNMQFGGLGIHAGSLTIQTGAQLTLLNAFKGGTYTPPEDPNGTGTWVYDTPANRSLSINGGSLVYGNLNGADRTVAADFQFAGDITVKNGGSIVGASGADGANTYVHAGNVIFTDNSSWTLGKTIHFATAGNAVVMNLTDSWLTFGNRVYLGNGLGADFAATLNNSSISGEWYFRIGEKSKATLTLSNGSFLYQNSSNYDHLVLGNGTGADVTVTLNDTSYIEARDRDIYIAANMEGQGHGAQSTVTLNGNAQIKAAKGLYIGSVDEGTKSVKSTQGSLYLNDDAHVTAGYHIRVGEHFGNGYVEMRDRSILETNNNESILVGYRGGIGELNAYNSSQIIVANEFIIGQSHDNNQEQNGDAGGAVGLVSLYDDVKLTIGKELIVGQDRADNANNILNLYDNAQVSVANGSVNVGFKNSKGVINMLNRYDDEGNVIGVNNTSINASEPGAVLALARDWEDSYGQVNMEGNATIDSWRGWIAIAGSRQTAEINMSGDSVLTFHSNVNGEDQGVRVAQGNDNKGTINLSGNAKFEAKADLFLGIRSNENTVGTINISENAKMTIGHQLVMAHYSSGSAIINVSGGTLEAPTIIVGEHWANNGSRREVNVSGTGVVNVDDVLAVGSRGSNGTLTVSGGEVNAGSLYIGRNDHGGDPDYAGGTLVMGDADNATANGVINVTNDFVVGHLNAQGRATVGSASAINVGQNAYIGRDGYAEMTLNDTATLKVTGSLWVGGGPGAQDGTNYLPAWTANDAAHRGKADAGNAGIGTLTVNGDAIVDVSSGSVTLGQTYTVVDLDEGGNVTATHGTHGAGTLNLNGGTIKAKGIVKGDGSAELNFNGGTLFATGDNADFLSGFDAANTHVGDAGFTINTNGHTVGITGGLEGTGDITKIGAGEFTLSGDNSAYTGTVEITEGAGVVADGTTLSVILDGAKGAVNAVDAENLLAVAGGTSLTFADGAVLNVLLLNPGSLAEGTYVYNVFTGNVIYDSSKITINGAVADGYAYTMLANGQLRLTVVPEPSSYAIFAGAVLLAGVVVRRRRK